MHVKIAEATIAQVRQRVSEGDCPVTPAVSVEILEDLVLHLADRLCDKDVGGNGGGPILVKNASGWQVLGEDGQRFDLVPAGKATKNRIMLDDADFAAMEP